MFVYHKYILYFPCFLFYKVLQSKHIHYSFLLFFAADNNFDICPKMKEHLMILAEHGFVSRYSPYIFLKMLEAYMKTFILALCPKALLTGLKRLYKYRIKKYEEIKL